MHAVTYLLKLQIDMILGERGQACPGMPKEAIKTAGVYSVMRIVVFGF